MLFYLDDELLPQLDIDHKLYQLTRDVIEAIGLERYRGNNIVFLGDLLCKEIESRLGGDISINSIRALKRAAGRAYQKRNLLKELPFYTKIVPGENIFDYQALEERSVSRLSVDAVPNLGVFGVGRFLVENLNDGHYYSESSSIMLSKMLMFRDVGTKNEKVLGGGDTTVTQYDQIKMDRRCTCLCVLDSDRSFLNSACGETAKKVLNSDKKFPSPLARSHMIDVYSIENVIPSALIKAANNENSSADDQKKVDSATSHFSRAYWKYIPLKSGIKTEALKGTSGFAAYWRNQLNFDAATCTDCLETTAGLCDGCYAIPPIPSRTLKKTIDILNSDNANFQELMSKIESGMEDILKGVAVKYLAAFCVGPCVNA